VRFRDVKGSVNNNRLATFFVSALAAATIGSSFGCAGPAKLVELVVAHRDSTLRERPEGMPLNSPNHPAILFLAFDGVDRSLIYDMLRKGELPRLAELLGGAGEQGTFPHAHLDDTLLSTMPSSTLAAWTTAMTGVTPSHHGITGNEFFIREEKKLAAPAPVSFADAAPTLEIYTDGYLNKIVKVPTVYERMRETDPYVLVWVAVHQLYTGADRLLVAPPTVMADAFETIFETIVKKGTAHDKPSRRVYEKLDKDVIDKVTSTLDKGPVPDVLTVYLSGTDLYAHIAEEGPDAARRAYLREVVEPAIGSLIAKLRARNALANRYVVLTADHGHTPVIYDDKHALFAKNGNGPPSTIMKTAGYRVRPFKLNVSDKDDFDTVLAEGGATAYVYVADRSTCPKAKDVCDWKKPPRYEEDVIPMAEAFFKNNEDGALAPEMKGTLDLVLTRKPKPWAEDDLPFEVYVGGGKTVSVAEYMKDHPHPTYIAVEERLRDLAVGPRGERAGDIMLLAHNGDRDKPEDRYYFASLYRSWHGSPSRQDSEIPFIVAHPTETSAAIGARVKRILGTMPRQNKVTDVLLDLRKGPPSH
jgi:hypothetical protein